MRALGVDFGKKRIGVALSDPLGLTAQPFCVIKVTSIDKAIDEIASLAAEHEVEVMVVGVPYNMDGSSGSAAEAALKFIDRLREKTGLMVEGVDERLTTASAERALIEGNLSRAKRKIVVDKVAAALILQTYLDGQRASGEG